MNFTNTGRAERELVSWLLEFGYRPDVHGIAVAFRVARAERGSARLARELAAHEARFAVRGYVRAQRPQAVNPR